jgi:hypothetical protein
VIFDKKKIDFRLLQIRKCQKKRTKNAFFQRFWQENDQKVTFWKFLAGRVRKMHFFNVSGKKTNKKVKFWKFWQENDQNKLLQASQSPKITFFSHYRSVKVQNTFFCNKQLKVNYYKPVEVQNHVFFNAFGKKTSRRQLLEVDKFKIHIFSINFN